MAKFWDVSIHKANTYVIEARSATNSHKQSILITDQGIEMYVDIDSLKAWKRSGKKIALYCAGLHGQLFLLVLKLLGIEADFFLDNDKGKWNTKIDGIACYEPAAWAGREDILVFICVALEHYYEVLESAKQNGIVHIAECSDIFDDLIINYQETYLELIEKFSVIRNANIFYSLSANKYAAGSDHMQKSVCGRIAVYTGIFGSYDSICRPQVCPADIDYYFVSDERPAIVAPFRWIDAKTVIPGRITSSIKRNRYIKMHPHIIFPDYEYSIYIDGNITITADISGFVHHNKSGISTFMLPWRECIYYEALATVNDRRVVANDVCRQMKKYLDEGMPAHYGLPEMPVIAREHVKPQCIKVMEDWWKEFDAGAQRDQLSFMYAMWKNGLKLTDITSLGADVRKSSYLFKKAHFAKSKNISNLSAI